MKVVFPVTIILLCALANQATASMCPMCASPPPILASNCKYGLDYTVLRGCPPCRAIFIPCKDRPKELPPNTFPSRDYVDLSPKCKTSRCRSCKWGKIYWNENDCCGTCLEPTKDTLYDNDQKFDEQYDGIEPWKFDDMDDDEDECSTRNFDRVLVATNGVAPNTACARAVFDKICDQCEDNIQCYLKLGRQVGAETPQCQSRRLRSVRSLRW